MSENTGKASFGEHETFSIFFYLLSLALKFNVLSWYLQDRRNVSDMLDKQMAVYYIMTYLWPLRWE